VRICELFGVLLFASAAARSQQPLSGEQATALTEVRAYALDYTKHLPDYVCTQVTKRSTVAARGAGFIRPGIIAPPDNMIPVPDIIEEQLTFSNQKETYQVLAFNGQKVTGVEHAEVSGVIVGGEFGTLLSKIFDPQTGAQIRFDGLAKLRGQKVVVFSYLVPQSQGMRFSQRSRHAVDLAFQGLVYADAGTKQVLQITMKCVGFRGDYQIKEFRLLLEYKPALVAGQEYMLPFHSEIHVRDDKATVTSEIDYTRYRKFVADSTLTFGADASPKP
jgi:hypothetical protein